jgi:hypothetical protein
LPPLAPLLCFTWYRRFSLYTLDSLSHAVLAFYVVVVTQTDVGRAKAQHSAQRFVSEPLWFSAATALASNVLVR